MLKARIVEWDRSKTHADVFGAGKKKGSNKRHKMLYFFWILFKWIPDRADRRKMKWKMSRICCNREHTQLVIFFPSWSNFSITCRIMKNLIVSLILTGISSSTSVPLLAWLTLLARILSTQKKKLWRKEKFKLQNKFHIARRSLKLLEIYEF